MPRIVPDPYEHYPPKWAEYRARYDYVGHGTTLTRPGHINRFGARYRLAHAFKRIELEGYSGTVAAGYNAITRLVLAWSAFESLLKAIGVNAGNLESVSKRYDFAGCVTDLKAAEPTNRLFVFVCNHLDSKKQIAEVENYLAGRKCCGLSLAKGLRHIFLHGLLTPNANGAEPNAVVEVCERLTKTLFVVMDNEFRTAVNELMSKADAGAPPGDEDLPF